MATELERWALTERQFITDDIDWLRAGAKLLSPSGDNITARKLSELEARLEHAERALQTRPDT
jgi:hypothetical protein